MKKFRLSWILWAIACACLCYGFLFPLLHNLFLNLTFQPEISKIEPQSVVELINQRLIEILFAGLFLSFGASIGSFLNVVAYRMPLNRSIVFQPSTCPKCNRRIAGKDNFPVLGWFVLNGKCRNCRLPISVRYPIVEAIVGSIFLLLFFRQLISGGANLPLRDLSIYRGVVWTLMYMNWELFAIYSYHATWFVLLVVGALFAWDGNRIPKRLWIFALLVLAAPPLILNYLPQVPFDYCGGRTRLNLSVLVGASATIGIGAGCGLLLTLLASRFSLPFLGGFKKPKHSEIPGEAIIETNPLEEVIREVSQDQPSANEVQQDLAVNEMLWDERFANANPDKLIQEESVEGELSQDGLGASSGPQVAEDRVRDEPKAGDPALVLRESIGLTTLGTGIVVGWQGVVCIFAMTLAWRAICGNASKVWQSLPYAGWFLIAALLHQMFWRTVVSFL